MRSIYPKNRKKIAEYGFLAILALQTVMMFFFCVNKKEYHIDEIYSYILSNSYDSNMLKNAKGIKNQWINGNVSFKEFVSVQPAERFSYGKTYYNNTTDAHPPFYYFVLHTVCSFFPDRFSKWLGLSINIVAFILTQFLLFLISRKIFSDVIWQLLPFALYGFSPIAVDIVLFIRMYSLLTLFTMLLFLIHLKMYEETQKLPYVCCFAVTFLGMFTQYFFAISAFFLAVCWCALLLKNKKIRELLCYSVSMISGVLLVFVLYPAAFRQATGSSTNNVGNEVSSNIMNFALIPKRLISYVKQFSSRMTFSKRFLLAYFLFISAVVILSVVLRKKNRDIVVKKTKLVNIVAKQYLLNTVKKELKRKNAVFISVTAVVMMLTVLTIVHISGKFSYLRYLYNIMPVLFLLAVIIFYYLSGKINLNGTVISAGLLLFSVYIGINGMAYKNCEYLYTSRHQQIDETLEFLDKKPLVLIDKHANRVLTGNFTLLSSVDMLYITDTDEISIDDLTAEVDISDGVAVLIINNTDWSEGYIGDEVMQKLVDSSERFESYEKYRNEIYSTMYWIH